MTLMTLQQKDLYDRIDRYHLDNSNDIYPFSRHLERENRWSREFTEHVISEYKKFIFLALVARHPVTPSDAIDRVWHLHLLYSKDYWHEFCPNVIGQELHHSPARGGKEEREVFHQRYRQTLNTYNNYFGNPPREIWPYSHQRFGKDLHVRAVNVEDNWIVPNPFIRISQKLPKKPILIYLFVASTLFLSTAAYQH